jgi:hypothetical protein
MNDKIVYFLLKERERERERERRGRSREEHVFNLDRAA